MSDYQSNSELNATVAQVKQAFNEFLIKRKDQIIKGGIAFEKVVANPESICEEIKNVLQDGISQRLISRRDIERYCPDKWKKKTKPIKNDKLSFPSNEDSKENKPKERQKMIAITTNHGISTGETIETPPPPPDKTLVPTTSPSMTVAPHGKVEPEINDQGNSATPQKQIQDMVETRRLFQRQVPEVKYEELSRSELIDVIHNFQKEVTYLNEVHSIDLLTINELKAALRASSFTLAHELHRSQPRTISIDLKKFGDQISAAIQNRKRVCFFQVDEDGRVIELKKPTTEV